MLSGLAEAGVECVEINYNWNTIMTTPALVCYDKNQWKTLQQLSNWNREWCGLFSGCFSIRAVRLNIKCSWMDDQFARYALEGVSKLPNIHTVYANMSSKNQKVKEMLEAFSKVNIFPNYSCEFTPQQ